MIKYFSQLDPEWDGERLGKSYLTIRNWGCLITSFCNAIQKLYKFFDFTPKDAAEKWQFLKNGKLIHASIRFKGLEHKRVGRPSHNTMTKYTNSKDKAVIVRLRYNPRHWVLVHAWGARFKPWFHAADPLQWNPHTKTCRIVKKWKWNIDGAFLLTKGE